MRLEGALNSSKAGINVYGQAISTVGDNVANASTTGFKTSRVEFADMVDSGLGGKSSETSFGGAGVTLNKVRQIFDTGVIESTGRALDVGIAGDGFFMVGDATNTYYTRAGNFSMRDDGVLVNSDGKPVLGYSGSSGTTLGNINLLNLNLSGQATSTATIYGNLGASQAIGTAPSAPQTFADINKAASSVSTMSVYDSLGAQHDIMLASTKTAAGQWTVQAYIDGGDVGGTKGKPVQLGQNLSMTFGPDGLVPDASKAAALITAAPSYGNGAAAGNIKIDLSNMTQFASPSQISGISKDGQGSGQIKSYEFQQDGTLSALLDTGSTVVVGKIPLANFRNVDGLQRVGQTLYTAGDQVGKVNIGLPGTGNFGKVEGAALENSTVDIADQFVNLVIFQRAYQANSQVLNTTNTMLRDTIGLMK